MNALLCFYLMTPILVNSRTRRNFRKIRTFYSLQSLFILEQKKITKFLPFVGPISIFMQCFFVFFLSQFRVIFFNVCLNSLFAVRDLPKAWDRYIGKQTSHQLQFIQINKKKITGTLFFTFLFSSIKHRHHQAFTRKHIFYLTTLPPMLQSIPMWPSDIWANPPSAKWMTTS